MAQAAAVEEVMAHPAAVVVAVLAYLVKDRVVQVRRSLSAVVAVQVSSTTAEFLSLPQWRVRR